MRMVKILLAACVVSLASLGSGGAAELAFTGILGEPLEGGNIFIQLRGSAPVPLLCQGGALDVAPVDGRIRLSARTARIEDVWAGRACDPVTFTAGRLAAGTYRVTAEIRAPDGTVSETVAESLRVLPAVGDRCNRDPLISPSVIGYPQGDTAAAIAARIAEDPAFAAALGNPRVRNRHGVLEFDFPPLDDIPPAIERLRRNIEWVPDDEDWGPGLSRNYRQCNAMQANDSVGTFVEFYNAGLDHYFYSADAGEIAAIEAGSVGAGWQRTGNSFDAITAPPCGTAYSRAAVYRFHGVPGVGPNSHFFTLDRSECSAVNRSARWNFEGVPFWASAPNAEGGCDAGTAAGRDRVALYRAWRPIGDSNHRFTTDPAVIRAMAAQGWIDEGAVMCVLAPA